MELFFFCNCELIPCKNKQIGQALVAHTCNPSYSGGRDQEDHCSKLAWANSLRDPILKKAHHKKGLVKWLMMQALSSNPSTSKKKKKRERNNFCSRIHSLRTFLIFRHKA
jgi:hypothetical protein